MNTININGFAFDISTSFPFNDLYNVKAMPQTEIQALTVCDGFASVLVFVCV